MQVAAEVAFSGEHLFPQSPSWDTRVAKTWAARVWTDLETSVLASTRRIHTSDLIAFI